MRSIILQGTLLAVVVLPLSAAVALSAWSASGPQTSSHLILVSASECPPGTYWEEPGYVGSGKWRDGHCARDNGHQ
jgi:hypothetical protein